MTREEWNEHTDQWLHFLELRLAGTKSMDNDKRIGEQSRIRREIAAIENIRFGAVMNPSLVMKFITQQSDALSDAQDGAKYFMPLNASQKRAVQSALDMNDLLLIQGPPGTGKTQVITEICLELFERNPDVRILLCSETHIAVNNLFTRVGEKNKSIRMIRIDDKSGTLDEYSPKYIMHLYKDKLRSHDIGCNASTIDAIENVFDDPSMSRSLEESLMMSANITGITCNKLGAYRFDSGDMVFDYVIMDEVCKAMLPEILLPLTFANKAILVGDPKQLPPVFCQEDIETIKMIEDCQLQNYTYIDQFFEHTANKVMLNAQYRMVNEIGNLISALFYEGELTNGRNKPGEHSIVWADYNPSHDWPWPQGNKDIFNEDECAIVGKILADYKDRQLSIAVIAPYKGQVRKLRACLAKISTVADIAVDTVDGFQGKEADIVIFCITRTTGSLRFFSDPRRLNVALSRAKEKIYIVGAKRYAQKNKTLQNIIDHSSW